MVVAAPLFAIRRIDITVLVALLVWVSRGSKAQPAARSRFAINRAISAHPCLRVYMQAGRGRDARTSLASRKLPLIIVIIIGLALLHRTF
jgi:hypothetical protein